MTVFERGSEPFEPPGDGSAWWRPGMSEAEQALWESAAGEAARAPEITPGSAVALRLQPLLAGLGDDIRAARAARQTSTAQNPAA